MCGVDIALLLGVGPICIICLKEDFFSKSSFTVPVNAGQIVGAPYVLKGYTK